MEADGQRPGWRWAIAAVVPAPAEVLLSLDPTRARPDRRPTLTVEAAIDNLLAGSDGTGRRRR